MSSNIGAPGTEITRRELLAATGSAGAYSLAGCSAPESRTPGPEDAVAQAGSSLPTTSPPEVVDLDEQGGSVTLSTVPSRHPVHPLDSMGGPIEFPRVWAWQADDREPSVPGPILRATEGQELKITLDNSGANQPHTAHFHGVQKAWGEDGVPTTTGIQVNPGEQHTYTIPTNVPGTHIYHCHYQTHRHIDMGMYGILRVDPEGYEPADKEYFMTLKEWDSRLPEMMNGGDADYSPRNRTPDVFTINGKSLPRTIHPEEGSPIIVDQGDTVRLHLVNAGYHAHPFHLHNHRYQIVAKDGGQIPEAAQHEQDITNVPPAGRHTLEFEADADPGIYLMHCHKVHHAMNGESYPGGMVNAIVYRDAMDTDIFSQLMEYAGYEG